MAVDSSIYGRIEQPKPVNLLAQYADAMQVQGAQQANQINQLRLMGAQRDMERQNKLAELMQNTPDDQRESALTRGGFIKEAIELGKAKTDRVKADADARTSSLGATQKQIELTGQIFGQVRANPTPENAAAAFDAAVRYGLMPAEQAQQFKTLMAADPSKIGTFADGIFRSALSAKDQLFKTETRDAGGFVQTTATDPVSLKQTVIGQTAKTQSPDSAASVAATIRGQNLTDARAREANANAGWTYDADRGVRINTRSGAVAPVNLPAGAAMPGKPLNEGQGKANLFGTRMQESHRILTELEGAGVMRPGNIKAIAEGVAGAVPFIGDSLATAAGAATNWTQSAGQQKVEQARRDFINAVLRRESGAVISPEEFANVVVFIASPAASYVTGCLLDARGGL